MDVRTVLILTAINLFAIAGAMTLVMGRQLSTAARLARNSLAVQAAGWAAYLLGHALSLKALTVLAVCAAAATNYLMLRALEEWVGRQSPRWRYTFLIIGFAMPIGVLPLMDSYALRAGWANLLMAVQFGMLAYVCSGLNTRSQSGRWQYLIGTCYGTIALLTAGRGVLGFFFPSSYPNVTDPHPLNIAMHVLVNVSAVLIMMGILVAWRREIEVQLENQAHTDPLTGLLNRRGWLLKTRTATERARKRQKAVAVVLLDIDHFKRVNDVYGHAVGDRALTLLGRSIRSCLRENDLAGRFGGEEFVLLLPNIDQDGAITLDNRLRDHYGRATLERLGFALNFSSGLAFCDWDYDDPLKRALTQADASMYMAKSHGRGQLYANADINITIPDQLI